MFGFLSRFVDSNERELARIQPQVDRINALEPEFEALSDDEIRARIDEIREEAHEIVADEPAYDPDDEADLPRERRRELAEERHKKHLAEVQKALDEVLPEVFAAARESMRRTLGMRHFDVQLIGGIVLTRARSPR